MSWLNATSRISTTLRRFIDGDDGESKDVVFFEPLDGMSLSPVFLLLLREACNRVTRPFGALFGVAFGVAFGVGAVIVVSISVLVGAFACVVLVVAIDLWSISGSLTKSPRQFRALSMYTW